MARMFIDPARRDEGRARTRLRLQELAQAQDNMNIATLALRSGLTRDLVERYWKNRTKVFHAEALAQLAWALNVSIGDLFTDAPEPAANPLGPKRTSASVRPSRRSDRS